MTLKLIPTGYNPIIESLGDFKKAIHDILLGLEFLHDRGFVHRDVRWPNVIRDETGTYTFRLILDFEHSGRVGSPDFTLVSWPPLEKGVFNQKCNIKMVSHMAREYIFLSERRFQVLGRLGSEAYADVTPSTCSPRRASGVSRNYLGKMSKRGTKTIDDEYIYQSRGSISIQYIHRRTIIKGGGVG